MHESREGFISVVPLAIMKNIVLASRSPRRKELMQFLGVPFRVIPSDFPEEDVGRDDFDDPREYVATLATGKALTIAPQFPDALIIGVDTIVFLNGQYFGKPSDLHDARRILCALRGKHHQVFTGLYIEDTLTHEHSLEVVESLVTFFPFSDETLDAYISTSESLGKAGAYAIQGGAKKLVRSVEGSLSSVVGLPLRELADMLERFNVRIDVDVDKIIEEHFTHKQ